MTPARRRGRAGALPRACRPAARRPRRPAPSDTPTGGPALDQAISTWLHKQRAVAARGAVSELRCPLLEEHARNELPRRSPTSPPHALDAREPAVPLRGAARRSIRLRAQDRRRPRPRQPVPSDDARGCPARAAGAGRRRRAAASPIRSRCRARGPSRGAQPRRGGHADYDSAARSSSAGFDGSGGTKGDMSARGAARRGARPASAFRRGCRDNKRPSPRTYASASGRRSSVGKGPDSNRDPMSASGSS